MQFTNLVNWKFIRLIQRQSKYLLLQGNSLILSIFESIISSLWRWFFIRSHLNILNSCICWGYNQSSVLTHQHILIHHGFTCRDEVNPCSQLGFNFFWLTKLTFHSCSCCWNCKNIPNHGCKMRICSFCSYSPDIENIPFLQYSWSLYICIILIDVHIQRERIDHLFEIISLHDAMRTFFRCYFKLRMRFKLFILLNIAISACGRIISTGIWFILSIRSFWLCCQI